MVVKKKSAKELQPNIKVRLDCRTVITVRDESKLAYWKEKFPGLEILEESESIAHEGIKKGDPIDRLFVWGCQGSALDSLCFQGASANCSRPFLVNA